MRSYMRPLRKALSSQLALSSFGLLSLKTPILREEGTSNEEVGLHNGLLYRMPKKAIWLCEVIYISLLLRARIKVVDE